MATPRCADGLPIIEQSPCALSPRIYGVSDRAGNGVLDIVLLPGGALQLCSAGSTNHLSRLPGDVLCASVGSVMGDEVVVNDGLQTAETPIRRRTYAQ